VKLLMPLCILTACSFYCVSNSFQCPVKKIPVTARKADSKDPEPVTVRITDADGQEVATSTFVKNTNGLRPKKLYFCFHGRDPKNLIEATYKGNTFPDPKITASFAQAEKGAELVIDTKAKKIQIKYKNPRLQQMTSSAAGASSTQPTSLPSHMSFKLFLLKLPEKQWLNQLYVQEGDRYLFSSLAAETLAKKSLKKQLTDTQYVDYSLGVLKKLAPGYEATAKAAVSPLQQDYEQLYEYLNSTQQFLDNPEVEGKITALRTKLEDIFKQKKSK